MNSTNLKDPNALVSTHWLEEHLGDPNLRIFDCTTRLVADESGQRPYVARPCLDEYEVGHIPGAGYFDIQREFSLQDSPYGMTLADPASVGAAFARKGIDNSSRVVLYCRRGVSWSARFWWMLRWLGFDNASILDGGHEKWVAEKRALSTAQCKYAPGALQIQPRPELFADKAEVLSAISNPSACIVSALGADVYSGKVVAFGRPGKIPRSINVPQKDLLDPETGLFVKHEEISRRFLEAQKTKYERYIVYCGSGIFAAVDAFWLYQLGCDNIAVYDNSMSEWGPDTSLPMECDYKSST